MKLTLLSKTWFTMAALILAVTILPGCEGTPEREIKNPDTFICATIGSPDTLDPAAAYDTSSGEAIELVYETLIFYDGESTTEFVPMLATEWNISPDGKTYRFKIRDGVKFSNGNALTPSDVEYSFERTMVQDYVGGPIWMFFEPLFGTSSSRVGEAETLMPLQELTSAVNVDGQWVQFNLVAPYAPFLQILCGTWASIVDKEWCIEQGDWDGTQASYEALNNPDSNAWPMQAKMMGTGPWKLEYWDQGIEISYVINDNYWGEPANFERVQIKTVEEWATRKLMLENGDADYAYVPTPNYPDMEGAPNIKVYEDLALVQLDGLFFVYDIVETSPYIGSGKLDGQGIPTDFFTDINVRKAFTYCFDWDTYIDEVLGGMGIQPASPVVKGLSYYNKDLDTMYSFDLAKAEEYFKAAWGGEVWNKGFKVTLAYNSGNTSRKTACEILANSINSLNSKFHVEVAAQEWSSYSSQFVQHNLPCFQVGWLPDFLDAHNFIVPFMSSGGYWAYFQGYSNETADELIAQGIASTDPAERQQIYDELAQIFYDDCPTILLVQPIGNRYFQDWVQGYYYNPAEPNQAGRIYDLDKSYD